MPQLRTARAALMAAPFATLALAPAASAQLVRNTSDIPSGTANRGYTENVDFADVDLDGDFDAIFAQGGDQTRDQNRIWINMGGLQGGTEGVFQDMTGARFPAINDQSRDIEFVDIDGDGDPDIYVSNTSQLSPDTNRWWINQGGAQGGTVGFFQDDTAARWVGLGTGSSSVDPNLTLAGGGFIDWSCDCDFGDLDNDGDLDLVHSSYGDQFGGMTPTRLFLNDGNGFFTEFNPSGHRLVGATLPNGEPGLWADGTQQQNTSNASGSFADVNAVALDVDLGDIDGDFDLDILLGDRNDPPRLFANRLDGSALAPSMGGGLGFRDVSNMALPAGYSSGDGHYEQEMGDLDGDGDLDIYGLNWRVQSFQFTDRVFAGNGDGTFGAPFDVPNSQDDDNEADLFDYDGDGDVDVLVANFTKFTTFDRLYRNDTTTPNSILLVDDSSNLGNTNFTSLDADACDVDGDGDYDVFASSDRNDPQVYFENTFDIPDTTAPWLPNIEDKDDRSPGPDPTVVRVHVYDNAPYYITYFNTTTLKYRVDGGAVVDAPMMSSGGQVFRGEIPGSIQGTVEYWAESSDKYGNVGTSPMATYSVYPAGQLGPNFCTAVANSTGVAADIVATGDRLVLLNQVTLAASNLPQNSFGFFLTSIDRAVVPMAGGAQGTLCLGGSIGRYVGPGQIQNSGTAGMTSLAIDLTQHPTPTGLVPVIPGETWHFTYWYRDANPSSTSNFSNGISVTFE